MRALPGQVLTSVRNGVIAKINAHWRQVEVALALKLGLVVSERLWDRLRRLLLFQENEDTGKWAPLVLFPGMRPLRLMCAKTLQGEWTKLLVGHGLKPSYDHATGVAKLDPAKVLQTAVTVSIGEHAARHAATFDLQAKKDLLAAGIDVKIGFDAAPDGPRRITTAALSIPALQPTTKAGATTGQHPLLITNRGDSWETLNDVYKTETDWFNAQHGKEMELPDLNCRVVVRIRWGGDLCMVNNCGGLSNNACEFPCYCCLINKDRLGFLTETTANPFELRTLEDQNGWSHTLVGELCTVCGSNNTAATVAKAATMTKEELKQHRHSHFGTVAGRRPIFQLPWNNIRCCCLHCLLRVYVCLFYLCAYIFAAHVVFDCVAGILSWPSTPSSMH